MHIGDNFKLLNYNYFKLDFFQSKKENVGIFLSKFCKNSYLLYKAEKVIVTNLIVTNLTHLITNVISVLKELTSLLNSLGTTFQLKTALLFLLDQISLKIKFCNV